MLSWGFFTLMILKIFYLNNNGSDCTMTDFYAELFKLAFKYPYEPNHRTALREIVICFVETAQERGYRFSDILEALAVHVHRENTRYPEQQLTGNVVCVLLEAAAREAEIKGRELP